MWRMENRKIQQRSKRPSYHWVTITFKGPKFSALRLCSLKDSTGESQKGLRSAPPLPQKSKVHPAVLLSLSPAPLFQTSLLVKSSVRVGKLRGTPEFEGHSNVRCPEDIHSLLSPALLLRACPSGLLATCCRRLAMCLGDMEPWVHFVLCAYSSWQPGLWMYPECFSTQEMKCSLKSGLERHIC